MQGLQRGSPETPYDLVVVGGGVNGTGIARDAAGRGLSVLLCEKDDLAEHTSSASTKLIHGGLRYLEYYEFALVRKALIERELLLAAAPHIMWPLRFVMPHDPATRPAWLIRAGLFLYDHLARRKFLPGSFGIDLTRHPAGVPLSGAWRRGFEYSDGWVDDARLVALNACDAAERGARILTRTRCVAARRTPDDWEVDLISDGNGQTTTVRCRAIVNAGGPWVAELLSHELHVASSHSIRLVKGSHIVVPRLFEHPYAYIFQNPDRRIMFAIPYEESFTLIGTTDIDYHADPSHVTIDASEVAYLCEMSNRYFKRQIGAQDVVRSYSGVRPLLKDDRSDAAAVTRDYWLELNTDAAPIVSVFGGKITTFRRLAEEAMDLLLPALGVTGKAREHWTASVPLPGGDFGGRPFAAYVALAQRRVPWVPAALLKRYVRAYGTRIWQFLEGCDSLAALGAEVAPGLYEQELHYLVKSEWARTADDILWRRSKLGMHLTSTHAEAISRWLDARDSERETSQRLVQHQVR
jgi:glycerol-3-phosphate dehydrogenase